MINKILIIITFSFILSAELLAEERKEISQLIIELNNPSWYQTQAELWEEYVNSNLENPSGWVNLYKARRYSLISSNPDMWYSNPKELISGLDSILVKMRANISNTFEYHFLKWYHAMDTDAAIANLKEAYRINNHRLEIYPGMIDLYCITGDKSGLQELAEYWYSNCNYPIDLMAFNYNVLMSVDSGGILFTYSDNSNYPIILLQYAAHVRNDIVMININLTSNSDYLKNLKFGKVNPLENLNLRNKLPKERLIAIIEVLNEQLPNRGVYLPVNLPEDMLFSELGGNLYIEGLAFRYSKKGYDNIGKLISNFENKFAIDHLNKKFLRNQNQEIARKINTFYLFPFINIYKAYTNEGKLEKRRNIERLILDVADKGGLKEHIQEMLKLAGEQ